MRIKFGEITVNVKEIFFYNPHDIDMNICGFCKIENCPVPNKEVVYGCNSLMWNNPLTGFNFLSDHTIPYDVCYSTST